MKLLKTIALVDNIHELEMRTSSVASRELAWQMQSPELKLQQKKIKRIGDERKFLKI
jgi:hypothetical protein